MKDGSSEVQMRGGSVEVGIRFRVVQASEAERGKHDSTTSSGRELHFPHIPTTHESSE
jgi:hypothetical protein